MSFPMHDEIAARIRVRTAHGPALFRDEALDALIDVVLASTPGLPVRHQLTLVKLAVWICAFDDFADAVDVEDDALDLRIAQYVDMLAGHACEELAFDPVADLLREVLAELSAAPLGPALRPLFDAQLVDALHAMRWERDAVSRHRRGIAVSLEDYLRCTSDSICFAIAATAAAILVGERAVLAAIPELVAAQRHASVAVRLANDRASWHREQAEHSANVYRFGSPRTLAMLDDRIACESSAAARQLSRLHGAPHTVEAISGLCGQLLAVYRVGDLDGVRAA